MLAGELSAVELQIELDASPTAGFGKLARKFSITGDVQSVGIEEKIINSRMCLYPLNEFEKLWMERLFSAGELQYLNPAFAINPALDAAFQIFERNCVHFIARAHRGIRITCRAGEVAGVDDFNQRNARR